jgi:hypothetical protein
MNTCTWFDAPPAALRCRIGGHGEQLDGVDPADLTREQIYPQVWNRPDELAWAVHRLPYARDFFAAAAAQGDAILCWIG